MLLRHSFNNDFTLLFKPDNKHQCSKSNGGCAELCLLSYSGNRTCKCKDGFEPSSDGKLCISKCYLFILTHLLSVSVSFYDLT